MAFKATMFRFTTSIRRLNNIHWINPILRRKYAATTTTLPTENYIEVCGQKFKKDEFTNVSEKILSLLERKLYQQKSHPLYHAQKQIVNYFYNHYKNKRGNPLFSVHDNLSPIVSVSQNFDSLLVPKDHVSRKKNDNYYINQNCLLRAHMTAYQVTLMQMGLDNFLFMGDVYRRDSIDSSHYPVFHQMDGVRLFSRKDIFKTDEQLNSSEMFENRDETPAYQGTHSDEVVKVVSQDLLHCLSNLARSIFGHDVELKWVDAYFPFTHPSWELEVKVNDDWIEMLGCGIIRQEILVNAGITDKVGWAFGIGLERLAMKLYDIPDIRIFWSKDQRFLSQFNFQDCNKLVKYKPYSLMPPCINDVSFWLPEDRTFEIADFYELVRNLGGDVVEQVTLIDEFVHPKTKRTSKCFRITYRSWDGPLTQQEVNVMHRHIEKSTERLFGVEIR